MKLFATMMIAGLLTGCASGMSKNGTGLIYTDVRDGQIATTNVGTSKTSEACATNVLSLVSTGDMSISAAKKAGGITKVATVDYSQTSVLGLFTKTCTIVTGE